MHSDTAARGNPLHMAVEYFATALVLVESEVTEVVQHPTRLRRDFRVDSRDVIRERICVTRIVGGRISKPRIDVAHRCKSQTRYGRILGGVRELIDIVG